MTDDLESLSGVGPALADRLQEAGFDTYQKIAVSSPSELANTVSVTTPTADDIIKEARNAANIGGFENSSSLLKKRVQTARLTTGLPDLDELLAGGIETGSLTEFHGNEDSGRSAIAHQLAVTSQLPTDQGGLGAGCIYIDTRDEFQPERIRATIKNLPSDTRDSLFSRYNISSDTENVGELTKRVLDEVYVATPENTSEQILEVESAKELLEAGETNLQTIVVDSLTHWFLEEYSESGKLAERQQKLNKHLHDIQRLVHLHDCAAVCTNTMTTGSDPAGGNLLNHVFPFRVHLKKTAGTVRYAQLVDAPNLTAGEVEFRLEDGCITPRDQ